MKISYRFLVGISIGLMSVAAAPAGELNMTVWQEFPTHRLQESISDSSHGVINRPRQSRTDVESYFAYFLGGYKFYLRCAGLYSELQLDAKRQPKLKFGPRINWLVRDSISMPTETYLGYPFLPTEESLLLGDAIVGEGTLELEDEVADWAHSRLVFVSESNPEEALAITQSRLVPAVLLEANVNRIALSLKRPGRVFSGSATEASVLLDVVPEPQCAAELVPVEADFNGNWILLTWGELDAGQRRFPWLEQDDDRHKNREIHEQPDREPLLFVFSEPPVSIQVDALGRMAFLFDGEKPAVVIMPLLGTGDLCGKQIPTDVTEPEKWEWRRGEYETRARQWHNALPDDIRARCALWAERLGRFPVTAVETYSYDPAGDTVTATTDVEYITVREGAPLWAPLPPMLALAEDVGLPLKYSDAVVDCDYRTAYGPYLVIDGAQRYSWSLTGLSKYVFEQPALGPSTKESEPLEAELAAEVDKILDTPYLAPWVFETRRFGPMGNVYWRRPSDMAYFLAQVDPALDADRRNKAASWLKAYQEQFPFLETPVLKTFEGPRRERYTPLIDNDTRAGKPYYDVVGDPGAVTFNVARGLADYYSLVHEKPDAEIYNKLVELMTISLQGVDWATGLWGLDMAPGVPHYARGISLDTECPPQISNEHLGNLVGFLRIARLCGQDAAPATALAWGRLARLAAARLALARYAFWLLPEQAVYSYVPSWIGIFGGSQVRIMDQFEICLRDETGYRWRTYIPFRDLTPEIGRFLRDYARAESAPFLDAVINAWPDWYLAYAPSSLGADSGSGIAQPLNAYSVFIGRAWIMGDGVEGLSKYADVSWTERGDMFYLHKLAETVKACRGISWVAP